ncbi:hypothetical protein EXIGLDRAFT_645526 [Exidia glandulosa HHB12029]|uniref:Tetraspanin n=1 Tax=Exidia glandulosa HHB12029 TaxID=1314781 RepID=A0A165IYC9_EXIGL|nr:hypothetical protein EXIGLDRAFT_645526 [Exidia glandulosa HHB12029]
MVSKRLSAVWAFLAFCLLAAGGITIALSIVWRMPSLLFHFVVDDSFLTAGLALGIIYVATFVIALIAIVQPNHVTSFLAGLNWILLLDTLATVAIGSMIWISTLKERLMYDDKFNSAAFDTRTAIQDHFQCCGYFFGNETQTQYGGFCSDATFASNQTGCVTPLTGYADYTLNNIFTCIYGYTAILTALMLASICVINKRVEVERFKKIDAKRGGKGFV